ncbi:MAG: hypothetical protein ACK539_12555, partial [Planctomycetota bacterium]
MSRRVVAAAAVSLLGAASALAAQAEPPRPPEADRQRAERALQQSRAEAERLLDLRLRHDLGLTSATGADGAERAFASTSPATTEAIDRMQAQLREEAAATAVLRESYERLRRATELAQSDA